MNDFSNLSLTKFVPAKSLAQTYYVQKTRVGMRLNMREILKKSKNGFIKAKGVLALFMLTAVFVIGCAKQNDKQVSVEPSKEEVTNDIDQENNNIKEIETDTETVTDTETDTETSTETETENVSDVIEHTGEVINNGGLYVSYNGNVYYRQYTEDSYAAEGIFGTYEAVVGAKKNMMCMKQDGTSEIAFSDTGEGNIYIYKDRMYLEKSGEDYLPNVYAVDLDGSNEQIIGKGWIKGIDEETGTLVGVLVDEENTYQLHMLDGATGETKKYELKVPCAEVLALRDGVIYYNGEVEFEVSQLGKIKLCSVNIDGTNEKLLADTNADLYEYGDRGTVVPCIQFVGETIYFAYGAYGGTGNFYQSGKIAKVKKDGSEFTVLLGNTEDLENFNNDLVNDTFYVTSDSGKDILYYSQSVENNESFALNLSTGKVEKTDFPVYAEGKPFEYEGGVSIYQNASPKMITWIPFVDYSYLELEKEADYYTVKDIELCDNWVYYRLEANENDPEASIGWRDGYRRVKTKIMRQQLDGETVETLFEY